MNFLFRKDHPMLRYFGLAGIAVFTGYRLLEANPLFYIVLGPPIYIAYFIKKLVISNESLAAISQNIPLENLNDFVFLMPITIFYFVLIGFFLKQLQKEQGLLRAFSVLALVAFLIFIHSKAWGSLTLYLMAS